MVSSIHFEKFPTLLTETPLLGACAESGMIIPGTATQTLAAALATETGLDLASIETRTFPDGEHLVSVPDSVPEHVIIVASTVSPTAHLEVLFLQDAVRETGASTVTTVIPYLGYARQDTAFEPGQPISIRAIARAISTGTDRVVTIDPHESSVLEWFDVPTREATAANRLATPLPNDLADPVFLAPDADARALVRSVRDAYGRGTVDHFEKTRHSAESVELAPSDVAVADRDVVLADDIISTGGTMCAAATAVRSRDADRVFAACVHPVLAATARSRLAAAGVDELIATDTVERPASVVSAAPTIAAELQEWGILG